MIVTVVIMFAKHLSIALLLIVGTCCQLSTASPVAANDDKQPDYTGCDGTAPTYQCFGLPADCLTKKDCQVLLKTKPEAGQAAAVGTVGADFEVYWRRAGDSKDSWVGVGLSADDKMGDDSVSEFIIGKDGKIAFKQGLTYCKKTADGSPDCGIKDVDVKGIKETSGAYADALLTGKWSRQEDTTVDTLDFNMKTNKYYILLAYGPVDDKGNLQHHDAQIVSAHPADLEADPTKVTTPPPAPTTPHTPAPTTGAPGGAATVTISLTLALFIAVVVMFN
ncbi:unnamed protein product [Medioppia subpectinata]|uniref:DOMON domain-containing protein n=1 Tax=Medioppia subpectinata TaxID=1979941 RepID=A0A7R9L2H6_9ACAR|nr:unnamed protein product [Medioppia subpectinata]CAG2113108.1 unnamed protein product [Medioppia subpectinata]